MPYLPNLASPKDDVYKKSVNTLTSELERCRRLEIPYLVTHLGSHLGKGISLGIARISMAINKALFEVKNKIETFGLRDKIIQVGMTDKMQELYLRVSTLCIKLTPLLELQSALHRDKILLCPLSA